MPFYVVVYVGYEGIDHILAVATVASEAAVIARHYQAIAADPCRGKEAGELIEYPRSDWTEPDRVCVMTAGAGHETYQCCCSALGIEPARPVLY